MKLSVLIPTDLSEAAATALKHAIKTASHWDLNVIHLCESQKSIASAKKALAKWVEGVDSAVEMNQIVRVGTFKDIPLVAEELSSKLIFLGTHGATGMQKITGSNTLKLVTNSVIPYVIVQKKSPLPTENGYKTILSTVSCNRENKQKIKPVAELAKEFNSKVILLYREEKDDGLRIETATNLVFMKKYLSKEGIEYEVLVSNGKSFNNDTIKISAENNVDLITIMNMQMNTILGTGLLGQNYEQELLMNKENIPIMIVSPIMNKTSRSAIMS